MKKSITITAFNRPANLRKLIESLRDQIRSLEDYRLFLQIDGGAKPELLKANLDVVNSIDFVKTSFIVNEENVGVNANTYLAMSTAFDDYKASYNLYLEDDLVLSPDAFNLIDWYIGHPARSLGSLCLCNLQGSRDRSAVIKSRRFCGWGFLMPRHLWIECAAPAWMAGDSMWDNRVANALRSHNKYLHNWFPLCSRIMNTGADSSRTERPNTTAAKFAWMTRNLKFQNRREVYDYHLK